MENDEVLSNLNDLIEVCKDGEMGFKQAADGLKDPELKALCLQYSQQRAGFAADLQEEVRRLGGDPEKSGSMAGALHRGWINIKAAVAGGDEESIVNECERGEDVAKEAYEKALDMAWPSELVPVVQQQYTQVREAHDRFSAMQKAMR